MFMKHYAPNRCLYIKVAKLRTGMGSAEMSHLQNHCPFFFLGGGGGGQVGGMFGVWGSQGGCEQRIEVFVKIKKKQFGGGVGGGGGRIGGQGTCERRIEVFVKIKKKKIGEGGGGVWEVGSWGGRVGGSGWM